MVTRREKVLLELEDQFSSRMVKPIAATKALDAALDSLSGSAVQTSRDQDAMAKSSKSLGDEVDKTSKKTRDGSKDIDRYSGRLRLLTEAAVLLGPALVPIGAVGVPAIAAFTAGLGAAAGALGITLLAAQGLGDAIGALNDYQLEPTTQNLQKMQAEFDKLGPSGVAVVKLIDSLEPEFRQLQEVARAGLLPGVEAGLTSLLDLLPQVQVIIFNLATEMGRLSREASSALSGPGFAAFFDYLETDAAPTLAAFAHTLGNVAEGLGSLMVAFAPLSRDFSSGMESMSQSFANWAANLSQTEGFRDFVGYLRDTGPQVLDLLGAISMAFIGIARAAAPVGAAVVPVLTALANILATIANSPIGPPLFTAAASMLALSRATMIATGAMEKFDTTTAVGAANVSKLKAGLNFAAILAGIWAVDKAFDKVFGDRSVDGGNLLKNLTNLGSSDAATELDKIGSSIKNINSSLGQANDKAFGFLPGDTTWGEARDNIDKVDEALAQLVEDGNADQAAAAMDKIVESAKAQGISVAETTKWFKQYNQALDDTKQVDAAAASQKRYNDALDSSVRVLGLTRTQVRGLTSAMEDQRKTALGAFDAITQYSQALIAARKQAEKTSLGLSVTNDMTRKQRLEVLDNRGAISQLAAAWNNQGDAVKNNMGKWRAARADFIQTAVDMGAPIAQAQRLADKLLAIPKQRVIDIHLYGSEEAASQIERIRSALQSLPKSIRTDYYVNQVNAISRPHGPVAQADGGTVPKSGRAYADRYHYLLADGEEVISNRRGQADRYRPLLKAINAAADGATVGHHRNPLLAGLGAITPSDARDAARALKELTAAAKATSKSLDHQRNKLDALTSRNDNLKSGIESGLRSDIFATPAATNPWTSSTMAKADPLAALKADNAEIRGFLADIKTLRKRKVTGAALAEALTNPAYADMLAKMSPADLKSYQALYGKRETLLDKAAASGANATGYQQAQDAQTAVVKELAKQQRENNRAVNAQTKELAAINAELKKLRGEQKSGTRSKR